MEQVNEPGDQHSSSKDQYAIEQIMLPGEHIMCLDGQHMFNGTPIKRNTKAATTVVAAFVFPEVYSDPQPLASATRSCISIDIPMCRCWIIQLQRLIAPLWLGFLGENRHVLWQDFWSGRRPGSWP